MTALHRRLQRLEQVMPRPDPWARMDDVVASLTDAELRSLMDHTKHIRSGQSTTPDGDEVWAVLVERLRVVGITW